MRLGDDAHFLMLLGARRGVVGHVCMTVDTDTEGARGRGLGWGKDAEITPCVSVERRYASRRFIYRFPDHRSGDAVGSGGAFSSSRDKHCNRELPSFVNQKAKYE